MNTESICLMVGLGAFFLGTILGGFYAGYIAYREGVEDAKDKDYMHAKFWRHHKEEFE